MIGATLIAVHSIPSRFLFASRLIERRYSASEQFQRFAEILTATAGAVTIVNPAVRFALCAWIGRDAFAFILGLLAGARRFVLKRIVALIRLRGARVWIVEMAVRPAAIILRRQRR
jgi:hypothetical protein